MLTVHICSMMRLRDILPYINCSALARIAWIDRAQSWL